MKFIRNILKFLRRNYLDKSLKEENVFFQGFPKYLREDVEKVIAIPPLNTFIQISRPFTKTDNRNKVKILVAGESISLKKVNFKEPISRLEDELSLTQKHILNCIYSRHINGHIREKRLRNLRKADHEWIIPYKVQLLGEPVLEILIELEKHITPQNVKQYKEFTLANKKYWQRIEDKMISWWNNYYKLGNTQKKKDHVGFKIANRIKRTNIS